LTSTNRTEVITLVKLVEIEFVTRARAPEAEVIGVVGIITRNRSVVSLRDNDFTTIPLSALDTVIIVLAYMTEKANRVGDIRTFDLPRIAKLFPVVRYFLLAAFVNDLLENSVVVADTIAPSGNLHSGKRV